MLKKEDWPWIAIIVCMIFLIFLASKHITGFTIFAGNTTQSITALIIFLAILAASFFIIRINNRTNKKV